MDVTCHIFPAPFFVIDADSDYNRTFLSGVSDTVHWNWFYADIAKKIVNICQKVPRCQKKVEIWTWHFTSFWLHFLSAMYSQIITGHFWAAFRKLCIEIDFMRPKVAGKCQDARKKVEIVDVTLITWHVTSFRLHFLLSMQTQIIIGHFWAAFQTLFVAKADQKSRRCLEISKSDKHWHKYGWLGYSKTNKIG